MGSSGAGSQKHWISDEILTPLGFVLEATSLDKVEKTSNWMCGGLERNSMCDQSPFEVKIEGICKTVLWRG